MDKAWVDKQINFLVSHLETTQYTFNRIFFEPNSDIYEKLESGEDEEIQSVINSIAKYLDVPLKFYFKFDWGLKMDPNTAGQIQEKQLSYCIKIPFFYAGKKFALGAILAHEVTHAFLFYKNIGYKKVKDNELFTDFSSIFLGLGKLILNGTINKENIDINQLGYLTKDLVAYSYKKYVLFHSINNKVAKHNLNKEALEIINN